jgi:glutathione S-transferase
MKVYGISVSYYTGKLEAYLRYKGIPYQLESPYAKAREIKPHVGAIQVPLVLRDDGRWVSDSTPIIQQFEKEYPAPTVMPEDPVVRFLALLIEGYADEWLWRAASGSCG